MKLLKKIKQKFSTEKKCDICGKVISAKKNPKSIKVSLGYSKDVLMSFTNEEIYFSIEPEFYLCENHRKLLEEFIASLKVDAYNENRKKDSLDQTTYDKWAFKKDSKENLEEEKKIQLDEKLKREVFIDHKDLTDSKNIGYPCKEPLKFDKIKEL